MKIWVGGGVIHDTGMNRGAHNMQTYLGYLEEIKTLGMNVLKPYIKLLSQVYRSLPPQSFFNCKQPCYWPLRWKAPDDLQEHVS